MPLIFSYGTLQRGSVQIATFGRRLESRQDALVGFAQSLVKVEDAQGVASTGKTLHASVAYDGGAHRVAGTTLEVSEAELALADEYERRLHYRRHMAQLASGQLAWVYAHAGRDITASVDAVFSTATPGAPLNFAPQATLEAGKGLVGDRYYAGVGTFSETLKGTPDWEVTLIESEEIERFNATERSTWSPGAFRRNLVTRDLRLNDLVGREFTVGAARLQGIRLCEPCAHLAKLVSPSVVKSMVHRAGLRARIVASAVVRPGDSIRVLDAK